VANGALLDYETTQSHTIAVTATDGKIIGSQSFQIGVIDVAERQGPERVSVSSAGQQGNGNSALPSISADGRFVAYESNATNLVEDDTNGIVDVFVFDRQTGTSERVSVSAAGQEGNDASANPSISADGRFVAYVSAASNLVEGDTNETQDVFVFDRQTGTTERVSVGADGQQGNDFSVAPSLSADGRFVAYMSAATNLVEGDTNGTFDIFVFDRQTGTTERVSVGADGQQGRPSFTPSISADGGFVAYQSFEDVFVFDRQTGTTERVSVNSAGQEGNSFSVNPSISADGRFVAYQSVATNLVEGDTNETQDVFVFDRQTGTTERVSVNSAGQQGNSSSILPSISADGRFVAYNSAATNLVEGDTNGALDVFVFDRQTGTTERVSVGADGQEGNDTSFNSSLSADGRFVAYDSFASNLVEGDTNGTADVFVFDRQIGTTCDFLFV
jgi:hypothetical protein